MTRRLPSADAFIRALCSSFQASPPAQHSFSRRNLSAIDKIVENQISEWKRKGGEENLNHGKRLPSDRHRTLASSLGLANDYVHSKILADNNIRPESIQRRMELDRAWGELAGEIRRRYENCGDVRCREEFVVSVTREYAEAMARLDQMAKRVNEAIISDSMRFNGRSPVRHARGFNLRERILEAIGEKS